MQAIGQGVLDEAVAVPVLDERNPRHVCRTDAQRRQLVEAALHVGLLHEQLGLAGDAGVIEVGGQVGRPDIVELVADRKVEAFDIQAIAGVVGLGAVAGLVDVGEIDIHFTADAGVVGPGCRTALPGWRRGGQRLRLLLLLLLELVDLRLQCADLLLELLQLTAVGRSRGRSARGLCNGRHGRSDATRAEHGGNRRHKHLGTHEYSPLVCMDGVPRR